MNKFNNLHAECLRPTFPEARNSWDLLEVVALGDSGYPLLRSVTSRQIIRASRPLRILWNCDMVAATISKLNVTFNGEGGARFHYGEVTGGGSWPSMGVA